MKKDLQNGRSMIEMLGVLAIIGILTVGGFSLVSKTVTENKINKVIDEISDLARHTRIVFREYIAYDKSSCGGNMTEYLKKAKAYPDVLDYSGSCSTAKFTDNEDVSMSVMVVEKSSIKYYVLIVSNLTEEFCMAVAGGQWGTAATNGFSGIGITGNTNAAPTTVPDSVIGNYTVSLDTAASTCADGSNAYLAFR